MEQHCDQCKRMAKIYAKAELNGKKSEGVSFKNDIFGISEEQFIVMTAQKYLNEHPCNCDKDPGRK